MTVKSFFTFDDYRKAWDSAESETPPVPLNVDIELSATCNLKCPFCFLSDPEYKKPYVPFMSVERAKNIIDECASIGVPALKFNWRGEPTIHPEFSKIVRYAARNPCGVSPDDYVLPFKVESSISERNVFHEIIVNTNGNGPVKSVEGLMAATKVIVSIDSFEEKTYNSHRLGGSLTKAIGTFRTLLNEGHPGLVLRRVVTAANEKEEYRKSAEDVFGIDGYTISEHYEFPRGAVKSRPDIPRRYCAYPSQRIVIATDGTMFPCCVDYNETMPIGFLREDGIMGAWGSADMLALRHLLKRGVELKDESSWPIACRDCTSWASYGCKQREAIKS